MLNGLQSFLKYILREGAFLPKVGNPVEQKQKDDFRIFKNVYDVRKHADFTYFFNFRLFSFNYAWHREVLTFHKRHFMLSKRNMFNVKQGTQIHGMMDVVSELESFFLNTINF
jgi:hypothetical protein